MAGGIIAEAFGLVRAAGTAMTICGRKRIVDLGGVSVSFAGFSGLDSTSRALSLSVLNLSFKRTMQSLVRADARFGVLQEISVRVIIGIFGYEI